MAGPPPGINAARHGGRTSARELPLQHSSSTRQRGRGRAPAHDASRRDRTRPCPPCRSVRSWRARTAEPCALGGGTVARLFGHGRLRPGSFFHASRVKGVKTPIPGSKGGLTPSTPLAIRLGTDGGSALTVWSRSLLGSLARARVYNQTRLTGVWPETRRGREGCRKPRFDGSGSIGRCSLRSLPCVLRGPEDPRSRSASRGAVAD